MAKTPERWAEDVRQYLNALCDRWPSAVADGKQDIWFKCARSFLDLVEGDERDLPKSDEQ